MQFAGRSKPGRNVSANEGKIRESSVGILGVAEYALRIWVASPSTGRGGR